MYITLTETFDYEVETAIKIAKEHNITVYFDRDGIHGTDDLAVIIKFRNAGFCYDIRTYKGKYEEEAIRVVFQYIPKQKNDASL